jgi:hypothetical protein
MTDCWFVQFREMNNVEILLQRRGANPTKVALFLEETGTRWGMAFRNFGRHRRVSYCDFYRPSIRRKRV